MSIGLYGEYQHALDSKGRVNFPAKLRDGLGARFFITRGLENCLFVYSEPEWARLEAKIQAQPMAEARRLQRFFFAGGTDVTPDKQGRVLIPANLRDYAGIEKDIMIIGSSDHAEIWNLERYRAVSAECTAQSVEELLGNISL